MTNAQDNGPKRPTVEVDGVDVDEVADLLEEVAKEIRKQKGSGGTIDKSGSFKRVDTGQLYDLVNRS